MIANPGVTGDERGVLDDPAEDGTEQVGTESHALTGSLPASGVRAC